MDTSRKASPFIAKFILLFFTLIMFAIYLMQAPLTLSSARGQAERVFENAIPDNAPIRIKIKKDKEKSFKDSNDETWVRDFELEVTNIGDKPIFFLFLHLITDVKLDGDALMFTLVYGRPELGDIISKAHPEDVPIKPGETFVFKIHPGQARAWEHGVREKGRSHALKVKAKIEAVSFGDGTGYFLNKPYPRKGKRQSKLNDQDVGLNAADRKTSKWPVGPPVTQPKSLSITEMPATPLPASFLGRDSFKNSLNLGGDPE